MCSTLIINNRNQDVHFKKLEEENAQLQENQLMLEAEELRSSSMKVNLETMQQTYQP